MSEKHSTGTSENQVHLFVTMATPFGGHSAAAAGEIHGLIVLPSWRDLNPENSFITNLCRKPLPDFVHHELIYAFQNPGGVKIGENSDGVVALASQLRPQAQRQGGHDVALGEAYSPTAQYSIRHYGKYLMALTKGTISTFHPEEERFIAVVNGEKSPRDDAEKGWLRFLSEYPEFKDD